jgi:hypothetical protein
MTHVLNHLVTQYTGIAAAKAEVEGLERDVREQTSKIRALQFQKEIVLLAVWNLKNKRLEEAQQQHQHGAEDRDAQRRRRIQRHFRGHVSEVEYKHGQSLARLEGERARKERNGDAIRGLENDILQACLEVGKQNPEEVYAELSSEAPIPYRVRAPPADGVLASGGGGSKANPEFGEEE